MSTLAVPIRGNLPWPPVRSSKGAIFRLRWWWFRHPSVKDMPLMWWSFVRHSWFPNLASLLSSIVYFDSEYDCFPHLINVDLEKKENSYVCIFVPGSHGSL